MNIRILQCIPAVAVLLSSPAALGQESGSPSPDGLTPGDLPGLEESTAEPSASNEADMARKLANPVGSVYSVPIETTFDYGADNGEATFINLQPVIPVTLNSDWNLINRTIIPLIDAPGTPAGKLGNPEPQSGSRQFGLGDITHSMFLSPANPGNVIWGAGPILGFPSATSSQLGSQMWTAGPTAVALTQPKPFTVGLLVGNLWSYAGHSDRSHINQMFLQYFINYDMGSGWYLTTTPTMTANWRAVSNERWTIPVGGGVGKVFKIGKLPVRTQLQAFYNVEKPTGGADWTALFTVQLVFPRK